MFAFLTRTTPALLLLALLAAACEPAPTGPPEPETVLAEAGPLKMDPVQTPYYADLAHGFIPNDGTWAAIVFKRPPDCVRPDFDLLAFFDVPAVFGCQPMTVTGHAIFASPSDPMQGVPPREEHYTGEAVPVWFALLAEIDAAGGDGLTIAELSELPSLRRGVATRFSQTVKNSDHATGGHGRRPGSSATVAGGHLVGGGDFFFQMSERIVGGVSRDYLRVTIDLP